mmetsp:Transcript_64919/g.156937  ORF Transcript_64919/g.156937 Transcript_64919/m.156937 type:complete len:368 (+) Transcript_64919:3-1106(+)
MSMRQRERPPKCRLSGDFKLCRQSWTRSRVRLLAAGHLPSLLQLRRQRVALARAERDAESQVRVLASSGGLAEDAGLLGRLLPREFELQGQFEAGKGERVGLGTLRRGQRRQLQGRLRARPRPPRQRGDLPPRNGQLRHVQARHRAGRRLVLPRGLVPPVHHQFPVVVQLFWRVAQGPGVPLHCLRHEGLVGEQALGRAGHGARAALHSLEREVAVCAELPGSVLEGRSVLGHGLHHELLVALQPRRGVLKGQAGLHHGRLRHHLVIPELGRGKVQRQAVVPHRREDGGAVAPKRLRSAGEQEAVLRHGPDRALAVLPIDPHLAQNLQRLLPPAHGRCEDHPVSLRHVGQALPAPLPLQPANAPWTA